MKLTLTFFLILSSLVIWKQNVAAEPVPAGYACTFYSDTSKGIPKYLQKVFRALPEYKVLEHCVTPGISENVRVFGPPKEFSGYKYFEMFSLVLFESDMKSSQIKAKYGNGRAEYFGVLVCVLTRQCNHYSDKGFVQATRISVEEFTIIYNRWNHLDFKEFKYSSEKTDAKLMTKAVENGAMPILHGLSLINRENGKVAFVFEVQGFGNWLIHVSDIFGKPKINVIRKE